MEPVTEASRELARESLIAISQSIPEKNLHSNLLPTNHADANGVNVKESGEAEEYRSKLISISSNLLPTNYADANGVNVKESREAEEYRSKLISISYPESSYAQPSPTALENIRS